MQNSKTLTVSVVDPKTPIVNCEIIIPQTGIRTMIGTSIGLVIIAFAGAAIVINKKKTSVEE